MEALEGAKPEMREAIRQKIAQQEARLEELGALLEKRTAQREKKLEDKEGSIRELKAQIQELESALERVSTDKEAAELKAALNSNVNKLEELMAELHQPKWEFAELRIAIERSRGHLNGLREISGILKETGAGADIMRLIQMKMKQTEDELVELTGHLEHRRAEMKAERPGSAFNYQTFGMNLLTHAIEKVYGCFDPSGMTLPLGFDTPSATQPKGFGTLVQEKIAHPIGIQMHYGTQNWGEGSGGGLLAIDI